MSQRSAIVAGSQYIADTTAYVAISCAYRTWMIEEDQTLSVLRGMGVNPRHVHTVREVTDSMDEIAKLRQIVESLGIDEIILVAEEWHAKRAAMILRAEFFEIQIKVVAFRTPKFERTLEPHPNPILRFVKSARTGTWPTWVLWNLLFQKLTPWMIKRHELKERKELLQIL
ncbi:MAG: ElyC/SanA/YdcF family protein [Patescibacteria group bacterium]